MVPQAEMFTGLIILEAIVKIISAISIALGVQVQLVGSERCCEHGIWSLILSPEQVGSLPLCAVEAVEQKPSSASQSGGYQLECWGEGLWGRRWGGGAEVWGLGREQEGLALSRLLWLFQGTKETCPLGLKPGEILAGTLLSCPATFLLLCLPPTVYLFSTSQEERF